MEKPLDFIDVKEPETGRVSSLQIGGTARDNDKIFILGGLTHGSVIEPKSPADADKLIAWLKNWKKNQL